MEREDTNDSARIISKRRRDDCSITCIGSRPAMIFVAVFVVDILDGHLLPAHGFVVKGGLAGFLVTGAEGLLKEGEVERARGWSKNLTR